MNTHEAGPATTIDRPPEAVLSRALLDRWPSLLGLGVAVLLLATGAADRDTLALGVTAAAVCYLAAGALGRRWVAWASVLGVFVVAVLGESVGLPRWASFGLTGVVLVAVGLWRGAGRPTLTQAAALLGFGGVAVVALSIDAQVGLVLAGLTLASHGVWDVVHFRRDVVVPRSMAEACIALDVVLGLGCILLALA